MDKLLIFPGQTDKGIFTYVIDTEKKHLEKTAAEYHPTIAAYINSAKPIRGKTQILLTALGAHEYWGVNANGDAFPEEALAHEGPDYGYKTFELHAKAYKHHVNKDPTAAYGDVPLAVYNPVFHRVELIVSLDNERAPDIVKRIEQGDYPDWSMGCLRADAPILMADYTKKPVVEIKPGDTVINARGQVSTVSYPHSHKHNGTWFHIHALGHGSEALEPTTEEHPWLTIPAQQVACKGNPLNGSRKINLCLPNRGFKKGCQECPNGTQDYTPTWRRAEELQIGDYIATPIPQGDAQGVGEALAYLLGVYVAEGHITSDGYLELTVNIEDRHIYDKLCSYFPDHSVQWRLRTNSDFAAKINIYDKGLAQWCLDHAGKGAHHKTLKPQVLRWPLGDQMVFLGGWCDGDGGVYNDAVYYSTCNRLLAEQLQLILARQGCISSINTNLHKPSALVQKETVEYQIWVGRDSALYLKGVSAKTKDLSGPRSMVKNQRFISNGCIWSPITAIDSTPCDEDVYNLAIESGSYDDDSYVVNGVALHNCKVPFDICSICGNKAPSRAYYCEHLKYYIGRIHPETGKMAYAINTRPKFFDISQVLIGADRIAKTLMKVASTTRQAALPGSAYLAEKMAGVKKATIVKEVPSDSPPASQENLENLGRLLEDVKSREEPLPRPLLDRLGGLPLPKVLSTMAMMGIAPRPQEFQRIYLISSGHRGLADDLDSRNLCFDPGWASSLDSSGADVSGVSYRNFDDLIMRMLCPFTAERSSAAPHLGRRLIIMSKTGGAVNKSPNYIKLSQEELQKKERKPFSPATVLLSAAALYAALQQRAPKEAARGIDKLLQSPAGVGLAAALGLGLIKVFNSSFGAKAKGSYTSGRYENPDFNNASARIEEMKRKPYLKVAYAKSSPLVGSVGAAGKRLFIGVPLVYMASGVLQEHRKINPYESEGRVKGFARRNPDIVSGLLVADAMLALKGKGTHGLIRKFASADLATLGEDLLKQADGQEFISNALLMPLAMGSIGLPGRMVGGLFDSAVIEGGKYLLNRRKKKSESAGNM